MVSSRQDMQARFQAEKTWDIIIIGGGASGLGCAVDAATRGLRTLLLEQHDFSFRYFFLLGSLGLCGC